MKIAIQSLRAVECGPLRDVKIDFASEGAHPTTVLAGANGSGKTTVLEIITALFELISDGSLVSARPVVYPLDFESTPNSLNPAGRILRRVGFAEMEVHIDGKLLKVGFSSAEPTMEAGRASLIYYPMDGRIDQLGHHTMMHSTFIVQLGYKIRDAEQRTLPFTFSNKDGFPNVDQFLPSVLFFPAYRVIKPNQGEQITREETKYEWVYRYENATDFRSSIDSFLLWLEYSAPEEYQRAIRFLDSLDLGGKRFGVLRKELKGLVTTRDGQQHFLEYLSSGEQHLIIALLHLARRLTPHSIVLIDEMENALHPAYQYLFAEILSRMQTIVPFQLIVTTHAPAVVDAFGTEAVRLLSAN